jgi:polar amino acid transport system substrate-binding protein
MACHSQPRLPRSLRLTRTPVAWSFFVVTFALLLVGTACDKNTGYEAKGGGATDDRLQRVLSRGVLRVGYLVWEPCVIRERPGAPLTGIFPDMMAEIAGALSLRVTWQETTIANFPAGLTADQFDVFVGAIFVTIPRAAAVAYSRPIAYIGNSAVVPLGRRFRGSLPAALNDPGIRIAVLQGQALAELARRSFPKAKLISLAGGDLTAPLAAVSAGRADIGFMNSLTVLKYVAAHPETEAVFTGRDQLEVLPLAWAVRQQDQTLLNFLNSSLSYLESTGRVAGYQHKYAIKLLYRPLNLEPYPD